MAATSAGKHFILPAFAMSLEQFTLFLQALKRQFPEPQKLCSFDQWSF
jgi:hypothetical protein